MDESIKPATIRDVARVAQVAVSTVSAAINGDGRVKQSTRDKILSVAKQLDYRPNRAAAMLASREHRDPGVVRSVPVAFLTATSKDDSGPFAMEAVDGARERAGQLGYAFEHVELSTTSSLRGLSRSLYARGVEGIIVGRMWPKSPQRLDIDWGKFSVVYCGRDHSEDLKAPGVEHDIFESTLRLFVEVMRRGYRRIGVCLRAHAPRVIDDDLRLGAVLAAQKVRLSSKNRIPPFEAGIIASPDDKRGLSAWVRRHRPDAVIGFNHADYWLLKDAGFEMPGDFAYADLHATSEANWENNLAGMWQSRQKIGTAAMDLLDQQIRYRHRGLSNAPTSVMVYSPFHDGMTLPERRG